MLDQINRDIAEWRAVNPTGELDEYPRLLYNVNLPPVLVRDAEEERSKGISWRPVDLLDEPLPDVPPVTLEPTSADFTSAGGTASFTVTVTGPGTSGTWTVDKDAAATWLNVVSPTSPQTESGLVNYLVAPGAEARTAHFYVNGKTFTVNQTAP